MAKPCPRCGYQEPPKPKKARATCPACGDTEHQRKVEGNEISCEACHVTYWTNEDGYMEQVLIQLPDGSWTDRKSWLAGQPGSL